MQALIVGFSMAGFMGVAAPALPAENYRPPPPLPGPYSYGHSGCPGGFVATFGDVCEPYFPLTQGAPGKENNCARHYRLRDRACKRQARAVGRSRKSEQFRRHA